MCFILLVINNISVDNLIAGAVSMIQCIMCIFHSLYQEYLKPAKLYTNVHRFQFVENLDFHSIHNCNLPTI